MVLDGKVALVTGAGRGIGQAIAFRLAREGCAVAVCDIDQGTVRETAGMIERDGGRAMALGCDVASYPDAKAAVENAVRVFGRLDVLANVAGISPKKDGLRIPFWEIPPEQWERVLAVNLSSCMYLSSAAAPFMIQQNSGRIVNMASIAGKVGSSGPAGAHYLASKAGVISLTKALAYELGPYGITVNAVAPGRIMTQLYTNTDPEMNAEIMKAIPMGRVGTVEEVVDAFVFLASEAASYISGTTIEVTGGWGLKI